MQRCNYNMNTRNKIRQMDYDDAPIAMAYVPWQKWNTIFEPEKAINYGTIFPELYKPFLGKGCGK